MKVFTHTNRGLLALLSFLIAANSQGAPDAGQVSREAMEEVPRVEKTPPLNIEGGRIESVDTAETEGPTVELYSIHFLGNEGIEGSELLERLGDVEGKAYTIGGLKAIAAEVSKIYRAAGYPFARAILPAQDVTDGHLRIEILEGHYGTVSAEGDPKLVPMAEKYLSKLSPGATIDEARLERSLLHLSGLPGIKVEPYVMPGEEVGTANLLVEVSRAKRAPLVSTFDNHGNRYTGRYRGSVSTQAYTLLIAGDVSSATLMFTDENMFFGNLRYDAPLSRNGLHGNVGYSRTNYSLGKQFEDLEASGQADILSAGLSYPLIRSEKRSVSLRANVNRKILKDENKVVNRVDRKEVINFPLQFSYNLRDGFLGGGVTYGAVNWTFGDLSLEGSQRLLDQATLRTDGGYDKLAIDVARLQRLSEGFTGFFRFSGQWADENLDSSEGFSADGLAGVRAYDTGVSYGDTGWKTQFELRQNYKNGMQPYLFYDYGEVSQNARGFDFENPTLKLSGAGLGVRLSGEKWNLDTSLAFPLDGSRNDGLDDSDVQIWSSLRYRF